MRYLENCPWKGGRNIVDMITDGKSSPLSLKGPIEALATKHEATVNALITLDDDAPNLDKFAAKHLVTPSGFVKSNGKPLDPGFVKIVATQLSTKSPGAMVEYHKAMELAFRRKLILEVAGLELEELRGIALTRPLQNETTSGLQAPK